MSMALGVHCTRACQVDAILSHLPVGTAEGRAWSMRLAASILELAVFGFDQVDIGEASRQSWRGGPSPAQPGGAVGHDMAEVDAAEPAAPPGSKPAAAQDISPSCCAFVPATLLQLVHWFEADATAREMSAAELDALTKMRTCTQLAGARLLLERPGAQPAQHARKRWDAMAYRAPDAEPRSVA